MKDHLPLLKAVSRSFYITIRVLPRPMREPVALAYLLARATDTLADAPGIPAEERMAGIQALVGQCGLQSAECGVPEGSETPHSAFRIPHLFHPGEDALLARLPQLVQWLNALEPADAADVRWVLGIIAGGQLLDIQRFEIGAQPGEVRALANAAELEDYTYRVAGCVGEFWTRLALRKLRHYADGPAEELVRLGIEFGKGLQLVNILRDFPGDIDNGRCYLPADELRAVGVNELQTLRANTMQAADVWIAWSYRAWEEYLLSAKKYCIRLKIWRLRFACAMPIFLGLLTIRQGRFHAGIAQQNGEAHLPRGLKIPRFMVSSTFRRLLWATRSQAALRREFDLD